MKYRIPVVLALSSIACLLSSWKFFGWGAPSHTLSNPVPVCTQWEANDGYCGETSFVAAGLYYGQYLSQYTARTLAMQAPGAPTSGSGAPSQTNTQLLVGVNDSCSPCGGKSPCCVAEQMHLTAEEWPQEEGSTSQQFLVWAKQHVLQNHPVVIGIFMKEGDDNQYDHIVVVNEIDSNHTLDPNDQTYYSDDVLGFSDHGVTQPSPYPNYEFKYAFGTTQRNRSDASSCSDPYSIPLVNDSPNDNYNCGVAITGIVDSKKETFPVSLVVGDSSGPYTEKQEMQDGSSQQPSATSITLNITVSGIASGTKYKLYRYNDLTKVPSSDFNTKASQASESWTFTATSDTYTMTESIQSNEIAVYRCVKAP